MSDLPRIESADVCANFRALSSEFRFPWQPKKWAGYWLVVDADDRAIFRLDKSHSAEATAHQIVVAVNTCAGFRANISDDNP